jgi:hypothetical protein
VIPLAPTQLSITTNGVSGVLHWAAVTHNINANPISVSSYSIEASDNPYFGFVSIGTTAQTQFIDIDNTHSQRFYRIKAISGTH